MFCRLRRRCYHTGWVEHARPVGRPQMTWGRTLKKALNIYCTTIRPTLGDGLDLPRILGYGSSASAIGSPARPATTLIHDKNGASFAAAPHGASTGTVP
jgi:hypothetical protein